MHISHAFTYACITHSVIHIVDPHFPFWPVHSVLVIFSQGQSKRHFFLNANAPSPIWCLKFNRKLKKASSPLNPSWPSIPKAGPCDCQDTPLQWQHSSSPLELPLSKYVGWLLRYCIQKNTEKWLDGYDNSGLFKRREWIIIITMQIPACQYCPTLMNPLP